MSNQAIGVVVILQGNDRILLGKRIGGFGSGAYGLPGGRVNQGEAVLTAASRELEEEVGVYGLRLKLVGLIRERQEIGDFFHFVVRGTIDSTVPILLREPDKCAGWEWHSATDLPAPILPGHLSAISLLENDIYQHPLGYIELL